MTLEVSHENTPATTVQIPSHGLEPSPNWEFVMFMNGVPSRDYPVIARVWRAPSDRGRILP
jgi:hypothetical protein